jgi:hypothetical protein
MMNWLYMPVPEGHCGDREQDVELIHEPCLLQMPEGNINVFFIGKQGVFPVTPLL